MALYLVILERKRKRMEHKIHLLTEEKYVIDSAPDFILQSEVVSHEECSERVVQMSLQVTNTMILISVTLKLSSNNVVNLPLLNFHHPYIYLCIYIYTRISNNSGESERYLLSK